MRYVWASIAAIAIFALGFLFVWQTQATLDAKARAAAAASGHPLPPGPITNHQEIGIELSSFEMIQIQLADLLADFWFLFVILVVIACFGVAAFLGNRSHSTNGSSARSAR